VSPSSSTSTTEGSAEGRAVDCITELEGTILEGSVVVTNAAAAAAAAAANEEAVRVVAVEAAAAAADEERTGDNAEGLEEEGDEAVDGDFRAGDGERRGRVPRRGGARELEGEGERTLPRPLLVAEGGREEREVAADDDDVEETEAVERAELEAEAVAEVPPAAESVEDDEETLPPAPLPPLPPMEVEMAGGGEKAAESWTTRACSALTSLAAWSTVLRRMESKSSKVPTEASRT
jgi:hypothetical protein